jgi:pimeloyl-ACP methyl ester carboxylesterase
MGGEALAADRSNHPDDVRFVLDELGHELSPALRRITDLDHVAIIGKSLGAATAMQVAFDPTHADDRIRAVVPIAEPPSGDGSQWVDLDLASGNRVPVLFVHGEADELYPYDGSRANFETARAPKFLLTLVGVSHAPTLSIDGIGLSRAERTRDREWPEQSFFGVPDHDAAMIAADYAVIQGTLAFLDRYAGSDKQALTRLRQDTNVPGVARLESSP